MLEDILAELKALNANLKAIREAELIPTGTTPVHLDEEGQPAPDEAASEKKPTRAKSAKGKGKTAPAAETQAAPTRDEVRKALAALPRQDAIDILARRGVEKLVDLPEHDYPVVLTAAKAVATGAAA